MSENVAYLLTEAQLIAETLRMANPPLGELMTAWEALATVTQAVENKIQEYVMVLGQTIVVGRCRATYSDGRGSVDYEGMAQQLQPEPYMINARTEPRVNWLAVCKDVAKVRGLDWDALRESHYSAGQPYVKVKLDEAK